jgi:hypothetical protein
MLEWVGGAVSLRLAGSPKTSTVMSHGGNRVLLVSDGTLYLAFRQLPILAEAGLQVDLLCLKNDPVAYSRYVNDVARVDSLDELTGEVSKILRSKVQRWRKIIITHEDVVRALADREDGAVLGPWQPGITLPGVRDFLRSKEGLVAARTNWHLPIPRQQLCHGPGEVASFGSQAGWPIVSKPLLGYGGMGLRRHEGEAEVASAGPSMQFPVLAQKYIQGRRGVVDMLCARGQPLAWLASFSTRRLGGEYGTSTGRRFEAMPSLEPLVRRLAEVTQFDGFCGFDWILEDRTGEIFLIEFHARAPSGFRFWRDCSVDFSAAVSTWLQAPEITPAARHQTPGKIVETSYFPMDLVRCAKERDWSGFKAWLPWSGFRHDIFWDDVPLFLGWLVSRTWLKLKALPGKLGPARKR